MSDLSQNTPVFTTRKTAADAEAEMKEETKKEMEKLMEAMKTHVKKDESYEELFLKDSDDESETSEESEDAKDLLEKLSKNIKKNPKKSYSDKKKSFNSVDSKYGVVDSAVKVEKLKSEISKLESRIRYKDLDMANLMVTQNELNVTVNKFKLFEEILNDLQIKEVKVNDLRNTLKNIIGLESNKIILHQLNQLDTIYTPLQTEISTSPIDDKLSKINNHNFSRLILNKRDLILTDLINLNGHIIYIKKDIISRQKLMDILFKLFLVSICLGGTIYTISLYI
jgi:hypothetical protein